MKPILLRAIVFASVAVSLIYNYYNKRREQDEREYLLHLKTLEFVHSVGSCVVAIFAFTYLFFPQMDILYLLVGLTTTWFLSYPLGNIIFRKRM